MNVEHSVSITGAFAEPGVLLAEDCFINLNRVAAHSASIQINTRFCSQCEVLQRISLLQYSSWITALGAMQAVGIPISTPLQYVLLL